MSTPTAVDVVMPQMGVSVSEGTITKWLKQVGEEIQADEPLLEISTDKVDTEVPSPGSGVVQLILVQEGETVEVGTKLAVIGAPGEAPAEAPSTDGAAAEQTTTEAAAETTAASSAETPAPTAPEAPAPQPEPEAPPAPTPAQPAAPDVSGDGKSFVSPVVARIASEHDVDVAQVPGTGRGGRVTKKDILSFIESGAQAAARRRSPHRQRPRRRPLLPLRPSPRQHRPRRPPQLRLRSHSRRSPRSRLSPRPAPARWKSR